MPRAPEKFIHLHCIKCIKAKMSETDISKPGQIKKINPMTRYARANVLFEAVKPINSIIKNTSVFD